MLPTWREEAIARSHDRKRFDCGEPVLNEYLVRFARQNHEGGGSKTLVGVSPDAPETILGYYSLSSASLDYARTPEVLRCGLGRYDVPVFRLGRLAVDRRWQGQGFGGQLLFAAGAPCLNVAAQIGGVAMLIDAKSERVAIWYARYGAVPLLDAPLSLVLPLAVVERLLRID